MTSESLEIIFGAIIADSRYLEGITYGKPRKGHLEGTVEKHIAELECNLTSLYVCPAPFLSSEEYWKLRILIHVHDTFKLEGKRLTGHQVSIRHPYSHASLARKLLEEYTTDEEMLSIAQYHDEGHALWQKWNKKRVFDHARLNEALAHIPNLDLYLIFTIIDGYTPGKLEDRTPRWFIEQVAQFVKVGPRVYRALRSFNLLGGSRESSNR